MVETTLIQKTQGAQREVQAVGAPVSHSVFPPFDTHFFVSHLFWLVLSFGFFYFFLSRFVLGSLGNIIEARRARIASDLDKASSIKKEIEEVVSLYEAETAQANVEAQRIIREKVEAIKGQLLEQRHQREKLLAEKVEQAQQKIAQKQQAAHAKRDLFAVEMTEAILKKLTQKELPHDTIKNVVAQLDPTQIR